MKLKAFTLIELLVVIAIIAILAAILFPVFAQAKLAAKKAASISNQKQISIACLLYANDYDDKFSPSAYFAPPITPDPRPVIVSIYDLVGPYTKNVDIFVAPGHDGHDWRQRLNDLSLTTPGEFRYASYIPNLGLFGENFCSAPIAALQKFTPVWSQTALASPVETIMFFDGYIKKMAPLEYNNFMGQARYNDKVVVNYADSHTSTISPPGIPDGGDIPVGLAPPRSARTTYYSWTQGDLLTTDGELQGAPNTFTNPYNDLHGVPGSAITDSEDTPCK